MATTFITSSCVRRTVPPYDEQTVADHGGEQHRPGKSTAVAIAITENGGGPLHPLTGDVLVNTTTAGYPEPPRRSGCSRMVAISSLVFWRVASTRSGYAMLEGTKVGGGAAAGWRGQAEQRSPGWRTAVRHHRDARIRTVSRRRLVASVQRRR